MGYALVMFAGWLALIGFDRLMDRYCVMPVE